jgi:hypothetical protein
MALAAIRAGTLSAAHGGATLDLRRSDQIGGLDDAGPNRLQSRMLLQLGPGRGGADAKAAAFFPDLSQLGNVLDIDDQLRVQNIGSHLDQQIGAASQNSCIARCRRQQANGLLQR